MLIFPQAKINLGLNIVERRPDGYHNLQTVFYPVPLCDALEVLPMDDGFPCDADCDLKLSGISVEGDERNNLVVRAYRLLKDEFPQLPRVHIHLHKAIPTQAGMGGGSSDASAMLVLLN
ncbi:MAG: 4-(cytidine 5'-diphospho)-2-C-methyl-D-erythritol kinase, partial [Prevotella sp.]|nr:4-(cytidine 5'-diphospho)-2-C-methyl-D-erythritol kinase [Prevotella sp.]